MTSGIASVLLAAGGPSLRVAERLGHENATQVLTTYGHLVQGEDDRARQAVDTAWSAGSARYQPPTKDAR